ncbi:MAG: orotidine 5'-phosphate decarboxylase [Desulfuromonadales bacterium GWD2_61_12]|nr:MAG: orotidine 5'-phosphate decarboxylase [Desulfuromonadales bacterium GWC2_61_20]OGR34186.1 MAG: orotidine 5'-phosphate decarboxylase [Desulfuromonadales bacterium GWD2_61_12]HAD05491.1 orotidine-5'-phosphate decarboxylase [Desulfuromonas sp.]
MNDAAIKRLIFALDVQTFAEAQEWVKRLRGQVGVFKVGKQLFTTCGPDVVRMIRASGGEVFLDLKYHDIPNTVAMATVEACRLGVRMVNVHALGGGEMMAVTAAAAAQVCREEGHPLPLLLAVTILTSSTDATLREIGIERPVTEMVPRLAKLTKDSGFAGVVASPQEVGLIRAACGPDFAIVTPGVRPATASLDDQKRVMTPGEAIRAGADYLVIGRPIAAAADPEAAAAAIVAEMATALKGR